MTSCDDIQMLLALQPEDRSTTEERRVSAHLAVCSKCAARAEAYAEQDRVLRSAPPVRLTPTQRDQLLSTVERKRRRQEMRSRLFSFVSATAAIAAVIGLILVSKSLLPSDVDLVPGGPAASTTREVPAGHADEVTRAPLGSPKEATPSSKPLFEWPTRRHEIAGWAFHDPRKPDHPGIDIAAAEGDTVFSIADGEVAFAGSQGDYGKLVVVDHRNGWSSAYAQLQEIEVEVGQAVRKGEPLGMAGSTGNSSGPHLHFELRYDGDRINPLHHLPAFDEEDLDRWDPLIFAGEIRSETKTVDPLAGPPGPALTLGERDPGDPFAPARVETPFETHIFLRWRVISPLSANWRVFAHLVGHETGELALQTDAIVEWPNQPCGELDDGPACTVSTEHAFVFPSDFPSGLYRIEIGLYDEETGRRAWVTSPAAAAGNTSAVLSRVRIVSEDEAFVNGHVERELARLFVDDLDGECGWEVLDEDDTQSYVWAICQSPVGTAVSAPAVVHWETGRETVMKIQMPRDGSFFGEDVRLHFPPEVQKRILDHDVNMDAIWAQIERDLTVVRGTVVDNALSAEVVTLEDEDGELWHVPWGPVSRGIHRSDGTLADFRALERGMTVVAVGFPRPEATTPNVLSAVRVTIHASSRGPEDLAAP